MINDKIIELDNGIQYYVFESIEYEYEKYILCAKCDLENDKIDEEELQLRKLKLDGENVAIDSVEDEEVAKKVVELIQKKAQENK